MQEFEGFAQPREARVLIVEGDESSLSTLERTLRHAGFGEVHPVRDSRDAVSACEEFGPDLVLIDLHEPGPDSLEVVRQLRAITAGDRFLPLVMISGDTAPDARQKALALGANDYITKPFDAVEISLRLRNLMRLRELTHDLDDRVEQRTAELRAAEVDMANRLALVAEYRDYPDGSHVRRVGRLAAMFAARVGMSDTDVGVIRFAAPLHDIGKIAVPDEILLKPAPLTLDELDVIKSHTTIGARMLAGSGSPILRMAEDIALYHHENWDGTGYTPGLRGENIPLPGRIVAVADVFDALTHARPYKRAWSSREALDWIVAAREHKFDPAVVDALIDCLPQIEADPALGDDHGSQHSVEPLPSL